MRRRWTAPAGTLVLLAAAATAGCLPGPSGTARAGRSAYAPDSYSAWARFTPGAAATYAVTRASGQGPALATGTRFTLTRVAPGRVTVEVADLVGGKYRANGIVQDYPDDGVESAQWTRLDGRADVVVAGHTYDCQRYRYRGPVLVRRFDHQVATAEGIGWVSDQVPGGIVRMHTTTVDPAVQPPVTWDHELIDTAGRPPVAEPPPAPPAPAADYSYRPPIFIPVSPPPPPPAGGHFHRSR